MHPPRPSWPCTQITVGSLCDQRHHLITSLSIHLAMTGATCECTLPERPIVGKIHAEAMRWTTIVSWEDDNRVIEHASGCQSFGDITDRVIKNRSHGWNQHYFSQHLIIQRHLKNLVAIHKFGTYVLNKLNRAYACRKLNFQFWWGIHFIVIVTATALAIKFNTRTCNFKSTFLPVEVNVDQWSNICKFYHLSCTCELIDKIH